MNRIRFSKASAPTVEPAASTNSFDARQPVPEPAAVNPSQAAQASKEDRDVIEHVQSRLLAEPSNPTTKREADYYVRRIATLVTEHLEFSGRVVSDRERARITRLAQAELLGLGPLEPLLADESITEIMVNGPDQIWVEREGKLQETDARFSSEEHIRRIIDRIISPLGRRCDETTPMVDARLPDGSRVNAIIPPLSLIGPVITIRKFARDLVSINDLIHLGTLTHEVGEFLTACVAGRLNLIVSGGTGSGKTTLLNVLSAYIPRSERVITIEDAAEL